MAAETIQVEVVYAGVDRQAVITVNLPLGSSVEQAIVNSNILQLFPEIDLHQQKVGIFSQICGLDKILADGDRVEIYRLLQQDPMLARVNRAKG